jgi:integrase/recombinase XerD
MSRDETLTMRDVQTILGHSHLSTTADIYMVEEQQQVIRRVAQYLGQRAEADGAEPAPVASGYDEAALSILFGQDK